MKRFAIFAAFVAVFFSLAFSACGEGEKKINYLTDEQLIPSEDGSFVKWEGRYEYKERDGENPGMVYLYHTATGFTVDFTGTELSVDFFADVANDGAASRKPYYQVAVDGEVLPAADPARVFCLEDGRQTVTLVSGLDEGRHTVRCLKTSEPYDATTAVYGMETDGAFLPRDAEEDGSNLRFMFVCASGGSGHGALAYGLKNTHPARTTANSSSLHSFNYLTARMFGADVQYVATSGWGVLYPRSISAVMDYTGITVSNSVEGAKQTALWDYDSWVPDVILFNIGGNDTVSSGFEQEPYQQEAVKMVENLHAHYPDAKMIWTHTGSNAGKLALAAMTDAGIMGAGYLKEVVIPGVGEGATGAGTYGANNHSSLKTHIDAADIIAAKLSEFWGYRAVLSNIAFEDYEAQLQKF